MKGQNLSKHYIVAFDLSTPLYRNAYLSPALIGTIDKVLDENGFKKGEDYVSVLGYSMEHTPSIERFMRPYKDVNGNDILWKRYKQGLASNMKNWPYGQPVMNLNSGSPSSMQSLAKPYAIIETGIKKDTTKIADRTILLLVTDEIVNGTDDDYRQEWNRVKGISGADFPNYARLEQGVFSTMRKFNDEFKFVQDTIRYKGKLCDKVLLSSDGRYKIIPYDVVPAEKPSINAVTDMPSPLPLKRVRGGFGINADIASINPKYDIKEISIFGRDGELLGQASDGSFNIRIPSGKLSAGDTISVAMSLLLKDGFYDSSIISFSNARFKTGMMNRHVVKLQDEAKVMGIFPLYDIFWWWFPNNALYAVLIWDILIVLAFIVLIMYLVKRFSAYTPEIDKIHFHPVDTGIKSKN